MIIEDYCSFEVAKLLKEKGFLKNVDLRMTQNLSFYDNIGLSHNLNKWYDSLIQDKIDFVVAPTLQMAMKWLREDKHIFIEIKKSSNTFLYGASIMKDCSRYYSRILNAYNTYEEVVEASLKYCLENLV